MFLLGYNMSVASAVGFIALAGVAAEIGVVMLVYLNQAGTARAARAGLSTDEDRVRPSSKAPRCACDRSP